MTLRQRILKLFYPVLMKLSPAKESYAMNHNLSPHTSFYDLMATTNSGKEFSFRQLKGRYVLISNTASHCGYTAQYAALQKLHEQYPDKLTVLGFPSNDFGEQEPAGDDEIANFCQVNFGVTFTLMKKAPVTGDQQQPVFEWLSQPEQNGWNDRAPNWNFCKYLVDPNGILIGFYPSAVDPLDEQIVSKIK